MKEKRPPSSWQDHKEVTSVLANERTYAAWIRTGLAALVSGVAVFRFLQGYYPPMYIIVMSVFLILSSAFCFILAAWRYRHVGLRLSTESIFGTPIAFLIFSSGVLVIVSILALLGIWLK